MDEIHASLTREITQVFDAAFAVEEPAGTSPDWDSLLERYGVSSIAEQERGEIRAHQKPTRGAPVMELREVARSLCFRARREAKRVRVDIIDDPPELRVLHGRLLGLVDRVEKELDLAYRGAVLPARGGMFANVLAHHDASARKPHWASGVAVAFKCKNCGAPKLTKSDTECPFCGRSL